MFPIVASRFYPLELFPVYPLAEEPCCAYLPKGYIPSQIPKQTAPVTLRVI